MKLGDGRLALIALIALAIWIFVALPLIYLSDGFAKSLHDWQTLIGAGVALPAATIAFHNTTRSLEHAKTAEENRRRGKHAAIRAMLPLALSEISDYAARIVRALKELLAECEGERLPKGVTYGPPGFLLVDHSVEAAERGLFVPSHKAGANLLARAMGLRDHKRLAGISGAKIKCAPCF